jgi:flagellar basal body-associated protein FliL
MADTQEEIQKRDDQIRDTIMSKLVETGEKDRLKDMLRDRLIQSGWRDELKEHCKDVIRKKGKWFMNYMLYESYMYININSYRHMRWSL